MNFRFKIWFAGASLFAVISTSWAQSPVTVLVEKGKSAYRIVIGTNALPSEKYAAEELQQYLKKISGAKLPIVTDDTPATDQEIILGDNAHLQKLGTNYNIAPLGAEGFI